VDVASRERNLKLDGIGIVPGAWITACSELDGQLVEKPHHYRDSRNNGVMEKIFELVPSANRCSVQNPSSWQINHAGPAVVRHEAGANPAALQCRAQAAQHADLFN